MSGPPFIIIPWERDFLEQVSALIIKETDGYPGNAVVIFMHERPRRYLNSYFQQDPTLHKPCLLPCILTIQELLIHFRTQKVASLLCEAGLLDQVALLFSCVTELANTNISLFTLLSEIGEAGFFPWGVRLASLFEECFSHGLEPENLLYTEDEVAPFGAALLGGLGQIFSLYKKRLEAKNFTTPGLDAYTVSNAIRNTIDYELPTILQQKKIFLAGFNTLTGTEEILFKYLWTQGSKICLHVDAALAEKSVKGHWACDKQAKWIQAWNASTELFCSSSLIEKEWHFFSGYDLHSQLQTFQDDIFVKQLDDIPTAIVLTHSELLLPILHHLPQKECNISLGYPLDKSLLFRLLENIFSLHSSRQKDGTIYWKSLVNLFRHPYLRLLEIDTVSLRSILHQLENKIVLGKKYVELQWVITEAVNNIEYHNDTTELVVMTLFNYTIKNCENVDTLRKFADFLGKLCDFLLQYGQNIWERFPLDSECLFRIIHRVIPVLRDNGMVDTVLPWDLLQSMVVTLIQEERVPFEADPITGLQVLGMLETRLLHFSRLFFIDVTDDHLPGPPIRNPLLPDSLRAVLGLPDTRSRDLLVAYTFYRLIAGSNEIYLYWQEGIEISGFFDSKKQRSRFIEDILWQQEQKLGRQIKSGDKLLRIATPDIRPPVRKRRHVIKTPVIQQKVHDILSYPISATQLDLYLFCPLRFYFEKVAFIHQEKEVIEADNPAEIGQLLHKVLRIFYTPYIGKECRKEILSESVLKKVFTEELASSGLRIKLSPESSIMLTITGPERLMRFLRNQPSKTEILCLEKSFQATIQVDGKIRILEGIIDRIDLREGKETLILDYKTGRIKKISKSLWQDESFWSIFESIDFEKNIKTILEDDEFLCIVAKKIPTIQLLFYIYVYMEATGEDIHDAAFVALGDDGHEYALFKDLAIEVKEDIILNKVPKLLYFLLSHIEHCVAFRPHEGRHCSRCPWNMICRVN